MIINALVTLAVANAFYWLGWKIATVRANRILGRIQDEQAEVRAHNEAYLNGEIPPMTADDVIAAGWFKTALIYDCPEGHALQGSLCDMPGMWVCLERLSYAREMEDALYDFELGIDEQFPETSEGRWEEVEIQNDCGYGCKIYQHTKTGRRALAHNSAYGCTRSFKPTPPKE